MFFLFFRFGEKQRAQAKAAAKRSKVAARSRRSKKGADAVWDLPATTRISHASPDVVNDSAGHVELDSASGFVEARSCGNGEYEVWVSRTIVLAT